MNTAGAHELGYASAAGRPRHRSRVPCKQVPEIIHTACPRFTL